MFSKQRIRQLLALGLAGLLMVCLTGTPSGAHVETAEILPAPGSRVGGNVDQVIIVFFGDVVEAEAQLTTAANEPIESTVSIDGPEMVVTFEPLVDPGGYRLDYDVLSVDGDRNPSAFVFTFDPGAEPVPYPDGGGGGSPVLLLVGLVVVVGVVALIMVRPRSGADGVAGDGAVI